jgi:hypothetical protein
MFGRIKSHQTGFRRADGSSVGPRSGLTDSKKVLSNQ